MVGKITKDVNVNKTATQNKPRTLIPTSALPTTWENPSNPHLRAGQLAPGRLLLHQQTSA